MAILKYTLAKHEKDKLLSAITEMGFPNPLQGKTVITLTPKLLESFIEFEKDPYMKKGGDV